MFKRLIILAAVLLCSCNGDPGKERSFVNQGNPLFRDAYTANPAPMVASDGRLYVFCGHDEQYDDKPGYEGRYGLNTTEWLCYSTADMQTWTAHGPVLRPKDFSWSAGQAWAAQCVEVKGQYYLFVTTQCEDPDCKAIGVAVASRPEGPYIDAIGKPLIVDGMTPNGPLGLWNDIDPSVMIDDDGTPWLCWGSGSCFLVRLKRNLLSLDGEIQTLPLDNFVDAPWLYKRNGRYYIAYASMGPGRETVSYAMARSILGPWENMGQLTGMAEDSFTIYPGIVEFGGKNYLFYHNSTLSLNGYGPSTGRRSVCVDELFYGSDGSIRPVEQTEAGIKK